VNAEPPGGWERPIAAAEPAWVGQPYASWGSRVGASLLDTVFVLIPFGIAVPLLVSGTDVGSVLRGILLFLLYLAVSALYAPLLGARQGARNGQTLGRQIVGIRVVRDNGRPMDIPYGLLRELIVKGILFFGFGSAFLLIPALLDVLWPIWDDENRALHDMLVGTHVVKA
jgi:uncharacterized RDD family membrane protein YckC